MRLVHQLYLTHCLQNKSNFNVDKEPKPAVRATRNPVIGSTPEFTDEDDDPYDTSLIHMCIRSVSYIESDRIHIETLQWKVIEGIGKTVLESLGEDRVGYDRTKLGDLMNDLVVAASSEGRKHAKEIEHIKSYLCCYYEDTAILSNPEAKALAACIVDGQNGESELPKARKKGTWKVKNTLKKRPTCGIARWREIVLEQQNLWSNNKIFVDSTAPNKAWVKLKYFMMEFMSAKQ